jgi:hypothetical protein
VVAGRLQLGRIRVLHGLTTLEGAGGVFVLAACLALLAAGVFGAVRMVGRTRSAHLPPPRPHPAARQFGGPASYLPHPPAFHPAAGLRAEPALETGRVRARYVAADRPASHPRHRAAEPPA